MRQRATRPWVEQTKKLQESKMSFIFSKLKPLLNPTRNQKRNKRSSDSYDLDEIGEGSDYFEKLNYLIEKQDDDILNQCLTNLAIGNNGESIICPKRRRKMKSEIFLSAENIKFALSPSGSMLRRLVTNAITVFGQEMQSKLFNQLGVCYSRQAEEKKMYNKKQADASRNVGRLQYKQALLPNFTF